MLRVNSLTGFGGHSAKTGAELVLAHVASAKSAAGTGASTTFSSLSFGAASADRVMIACISSHDDNFQDQAASTVTIGGQSATLQVHVDNGDNVTAVMIFTATVTSGTSGDVVVTWASSLSNGDSFVELYRMTGGSGTAYDTATATGSTPAPTIDCEAGGVIIGAAARTRSPPYGSAMSAASEAYASVQTGLTVGGSWTALNFTHTALTENNEDSTATVISATDRDAYVAASFSAL